MTPPTHNESKRPGRDLRILNCQLPAVHTADGHEIVDRIHGGRQRKEVSIKGTGLQHRNSAVQRGTYCIVKYHYPQVSCIHNVNLLSSTRIYNSKHPSSTGALLLCTGLLLLWTRITPLANKLIPTRSPRNENHLQHEPYLQPAIRHRRHIDHGNCIRIPTTENMRV